MALNSGSFLEKFGAGAVGLGGDGSVVTLDCDPSVQVGDFVRVSSGILVRANATSLASSQVVGVIEFKTTATSAELRVSGAMPSPYLNLITGLQCFLGVDGKPTHIPPSAAGEILLPIGRVVGPGIFGVNIGMRIIRA